MNYAYELGAIGGTFDHFHLGHKKLIDTAFDQSRKVIIGLTTAELYQHKFLSENIEKFHIRESNVNYYLEQNGYGKRAILVPLYDIYGPTSDDASINAIFVTQENLQNVNLINAKRQKNILSLLDVIKVPYVKSADGKNITSERIRKGEIDREGFVYQKLFEYTLQMPESLRDELHKPLAEVFKTTKKLLDLLDNKIIITVGDIITTELKKEGLQPALSVIDFQTRRHELPESVIPDALKIANHHGTINHDAVTIILKALNSYFSGNQPQTIIVDGEEDLLALPTILLAPLDSIVLYGQFDQGIVVNRVTEEIKTHIRELLKQFE